MVQANPGFAIVIPMLNEADTVQQLLGACVGAVEGLGPYEICVTDDGSTDATNEALRAFGAAHPQANLTLLVHPRSAGQSAAIHSAVCAARAPIIVTLDGDGQNPPEEVPKLLKVLFDGRSTLGLVAGHRVKRDDPLRKRMASKVANTIRRILLKDGTRDTGCGLKAFRRDAYFALPYFNHMHRYLPALFLRDGWEIAHVDVSHRPRVAGASKYTNLGRTLVGLGDLLGVSWLIRRRRSVHVSEVQIWRPRER